MVPVYVKGGAWSNTEDEVLRAAISKYGLNQWARVSTLLPKKTAKQCRARWQEYLDPRILKSDWSPEEDERLLNMARLLPNQWRSIAATIGRTATQCVERYQKLLDEAAGVESSNDMGLAGLGAETLRAIGASKESHVGDLNVNAEHREAIPDAVDLDDDEKEMLSEARARLANTKGKKATRKARERMLEESKRIALLQKRRDLKQAGITTKLKAPKKKFATQVDYNADIPFEHSPTGGFYDTTEETSTNDRSLRGYQRKVDTMGVKDDKQRDKTSKSNKSKDQQRTSFEKESRSIDDDVNFKRRKLDLPAPQFEEDQLSHLTKLGNEELIETLKQKAIAGGLSVDERINAAAQKIKEDKNIQSVLFINTDEDVEKTNDDDVTDSPVETAAIELVVQKTDIKKSIRDRLATLPKPKNDFEIVADDDDEDGNNGIEDVGGEEANFKQSSIPEDEGEIKRLLVLQREEEHKRALLRRSQAIQKGLVIPNAPQVTQLSSAVQGGVIEESVRQEIIKLVRSDFSKVNKVSGIPLLTDLDEQTTELVKSLIDEEINKEDLDTFNNAFVSVHESSCILRTDTSFLITELQSLVEKSNRTEKALTKQIAGYMKRNETLTEESLKLIHDLKDADRVLAAMEMLHAGELVAGAIRTEALREDVDVLVQAEQRAQERYLDLRRSKSTKSLDV